MSGPGVVTFSNTNSATTTATLSAAGSYLLRLEAHDSQLRSNDEVLITVMAANQAPVVNAGVDQSIPFPNTATLHGTVTDDGLPTGSTLTIIWRKINGPGVVNFSNANSATATATFSTPAAICSDLLLAILH